uniref:Uncharacterized protein n=1 Tax=Lygus hesperus TaxID=30085 RepID=A0A0A9W418_LYGHE
MADGISCAVAATTVWWHRYLWQCHLRSRHDPSVCRKQRSVLHRPTASQYPHFHSPLHPSLVLLPNLLPFLHTRTCLHFCSQFQSRAVGCGLWRRCFQRHAVSGGTGVFLRRSEVLSLQMPLYPPLLLPRCAVPPSHSLSCVAGYFAAMPSSHPCPSSTVSVCAVSVLLGSMATAVSGTTAVVIDSYRASNLCCCYCCSCRCSYWHYCYYWRCCEILWTYSGTGATVCFAIYRPSLFVPHSVDRNCRTHSVGYCVARGALYPPTQVFPLPGTLGTVATVTRCGRACCIGCRIVYRNLCSVNTPTVLATHSQRMLLLSHLRLVLVDLGTLVYSPPRFLVKLLYSRCCIGRMLSLDPIARVLFDLASMFVSSSYHSTLSECMASMGDTTIPTVGRYSSPISVYRALLYFGLRLAGPCSATSNSDAASTSNPNSDTNFHSISTRSPYCVLHTGNLVLCIPHPLSVAAVVCVVAFVFVVPVVLMLVRLWVLLLLVAFLSLLLLVLLALTLLTLSQALVDCKTYWLQGRMI